MNAIPYSAVVLVICLLLVVWLFLTRMVKSRRYDARLPFLLTLISAPTATADCLDPDVLGTAAATPETRTTNGVRPEADNGDPRAESPRVLAAWQELPVVLAAALRSRAM